MIRNLVFDMGNVLMDWNPQALAAHFFPDPAQQALAVRALFDSEDWRALDAGAISEETALSRMLGRLPQDLHAAGRALFDGWHRFFPPLPEMNQLAADCKARGFRLYLLSNAGLRFEAYCQNIPIFPLLDGWVVSAFVRQLKPDPAIYHTLTLRYGLLPQECFFVDDLPANVAGARAAGWQGQVYGGDPAELRRTLEGLT